MSRPLTQSPGCPAGRGGHPRCPRTSGVPHAARAWGPTAGPWHVPSPSRVPTGPDPSVRSGLCSGTFLGEHPGPFCQKWHPRLCPFATDVVRRPVHYSLTAPLCAGAPGGPGTLASGGGRDRNQVSRFPVAQERGPHVAPDLRAVRRLPGERPRGWMRGRPGGRRHAGAGQTHEEVETEPPPGEALRGTRETRPRGGQTHSG